MVDRDGFQKTVVAQVGLGKFGRRGRCQPESTSAASGKGKKVATIDGGREIHSALSNNDGSAERRRAEARVRPGGVALFLANGEACAS